MALNVDRIKNGQPWSVDNFFAWQKVGQEDVRSLAEGLLVGYETIVWPRLMRTFRRVSIEEEAPLPLNSWLTYNSRPDTLIERISDNTLWYLEDKTTSWMDSLLHYPKNVQLHATAFCVEQKLKDGRRIDGALVQGMYKGFAKQGQFYHPLVYAYCKEGRHGIVPDLWTHKWTRGYERTAVKNYPGGVREWIKKLPEEELQKVFGNSPPVTLNRELAAAYLVQTEMREEEIKNFHADERENGIVNDLDRVFPQHFNQCDEFGKSKQECRNKDLCFNPTTKKFPLEVYKWREPHHENEKIDFKERFGKEQTN